jgi:CHAT domain-containing protein
VLAQRQGASAVMASLWPVADASTRPLMERFYKTLIEKPGTTKATALREAQLALLREEDFHPDRTSQRGATPTAASSVVSSRYSHPYYWAPFILIGNSR